MAFDFNGWQRAAWNNLKNWKARVVPGAVNAGYVAVAAGVLWPLVYEARTGDSARVIMALMSITGDLGTNLLSEQILRWKDIASGEQDVAVWIQQRIATDAALRCELERVVDKLQALELAKTALPESDRTWFETMLRRELDSLGSLSRFEVQISGSYNVVAVGEGASASLTIEEHHHHYAPDPRIAAGEERVRLLRIAYLNRLFDQCSGFDLAGIDRLVEAKLNLGAVYTTLNTRVDETAIGPEQVEGFDVDRIEFRGIPSEILYTADAGGGQLIIRYQPVPAAVRLDQTPRVVLLGDPGSGKSTFINHLAMCFAGEALGRSDANLATLMKTIPDKHNGDQATRLSWSHGPLLPIRIILRDFAARGLPAIGETATADHLLKFIVAELGETLADLAEAFKHEFLGQGGLILLDGLDEVSDERRVQLRQAIESFAGTFGKCRIVITSRTYAYQNPIWRLPDFSTAVVAPFNIQQIETFIDRWYSYIAFVRDLKDGGARAQDLKASIRRNPHLRELAQIPLLLTLMASLHASRHGSLPENREELYNESVDLLLDQWERPKRVSNGRQPGLAEFLNTGKDRLRQALNELAFRAHASQPGLSGSANVEETSVLAALLGLSREKDLNPLALVDYLSQRTGLLLPSGVHVYAFPHRTFQEYLAACYLTDHDFPDKLRDLVQADFERWREVTLLAGAKAARGMSSAIWTLAEALCDCEPNESNATSDVWGSYLAGQALAETARIEVISRRDRPKLERIQRWLVRGLGDPALPAFERSHAGDVLAHLGDPRPEVMTVEGMLFCFVSAGDFVMGEAADLQRIHALDYGYWLGRHPVSVSQWRIFVDATGHTPIDANSLRDLPNHPVRRVTWDEAQAFCQWMNESLSSALPKGFRYGLPNEPEWEKAARGGLSVPPSEVGLVRPLTSGLPAQTDVVMKVNQHAERDYPWPTVSAAFTDGTERANTRESNIGATSALGCFPSGGSPYGCLDMAGNVWEWTRSLRWRYPYEPLDGREDPESREARVVRGGAANEVVRAARCSFRLRDDPFVGDEYRGFRVVASPMLSRMQG